MVLAIPSFTFQAIRPRSLGNPTGPLPSQTSSLHHFLELSLGRGSPSDHRTVPSSCIGMVLLLSRWNREKA